MTRRVAAFVIQLVQDVNVLRPLIVMATRDFGHDALILVHTAIYGRDPLGVWHRELDEICAQTGARRHDFHQPSEVCRMLEGEGLLFAASETNLPAHAVAHDLMRTAPRGFLRVTLQHGFECPGFDHSHAHDVAHGGQLVFAADILCSWRDADRLSSLTPSQLPKLVVTGPAPALQCFGGPVPLENRGAALICENLHSVRIGQRRDARGEFIAQFEALARSERRKGHKVILRPHPGGQYFLRNRIRLPRGVTLSHAPIYKLDLRGFAYGVSAPSSVLIDFLLAGLPTAVWQDEARHVDVTNYSGLRIVRSLRELQDFAKAARSEPEAFRERQARFLQASGIVLEPSAVYHRFAAIFQRNAWNCAGEAHDRLKTPS